MKVGLTMKAIINSGLVLLGKEQLHRNGQNTEWTMRIWPCGLRTHPRKKFHLDSRLWKFYTLIECLLRFLAMLRPIDSLIKLQITKAKGVTCMLIKIIPSSIGPFSPSLYSVIGKFCGDTLTFCGVQSALGTRLGILSVLCSVLVRQCAVLTVSLKLGICSECILSTHLAFISARWLLLRMCLVTAVLTSTLCLRYRISPLGAFSHRCGRRYAMLCF